MPVRQPGAAAGAAAGMRLRLWRIHHRGLHVHHRAGPGRVAADAHGFLAFLDLDFGDARFVEQFDQLLDLADIHRSVTPGPELIGRRRAVPCSEMLAGGAQCQFVADGAETGDGPDGNVGEIRVVPERLRVRARC